VLRPPAEIGLDVVDEDDQLMRLFGLHLVSEAGAADHRPFVLTLDLL
jgi:hypothetical protein